MTCPLEQKIAQNAYIIDDGFGQFPIQEFKWLGEEGLLNITLPNKELDFNTSNNYKLLKVLKKIGRANLSVGRIYEGHINALHLIHVFATKDQKNTWYNLAEKNKLFSVWNTQEDNGVTIHWQDNGKYLLKGTKNFCSGGGWIDQPLITGKIFSPTKNGWQMCIVPIEKAKEIKVDSSFWKPMGMRASASFKMDFTGIEIEEKDLLGHTECYYQQPYFSGGAIRFVAVQVGGAEAVMESTLQLLKSMNRENDVFQKTRLAEMAWLIESANLWLQQTGANMDRWNGNVNMVNKTIAYVGMARSAIEKICIKVMRLAEKSVGSRGLMQPNALERIHRDLTIYLKQPGPDTTIVNIGDYLFKQDFNDEFWK